MAQLLEEHRTYINSLIEEQILEHYAVSMEVQKAWITINGESKAYDWNALREKRVINDVVGNVPVVIAIASDNMSFMVFERPTSGHQFRVSGDTLFSEKQFYDFAGRDLAALTTRLPAVKAYQEFWHSWRTFHPDTKKYE